MILPLLSFLSSTIKINHSSPPQEACETEYYPKLNWKLCPRKKKSSNDPSSPFKEEEKEGEGESSLLGGQWKVKEKVLCLVANGRWRKRFFAWWPMEGGGEGSLFGGQWKVKEKVLCLVANGRWKTIFFHLFPLSPQPILPKPSIFPLDLKILLYHGFRPLFAHSLPFPWLINHDCVL